MVAVLVPRDQNRMRVDARGLAGRIRPIVMSHRGRSDRAQGFLSLVPQQIETEP
jgi:hypothetical protein